MKYASEIIVEVPINEFMKKFDNAENKKHWQKGLESVEHVSGVPGMVGAKMKLNFKMGHRMRSLIETVIHSDLPREFHGTYSTVGVSNFQENYFEELPGGKTKWTSISEYLPLNFKMSALLWTMPGTFKKQSKKYMMDFKRFAEKGISVANATTKTYLGF